MTKKDKMVFSRHMAKKNPINNKSDVKIINLKRLFQVYISDQLGQGQLYPSVASPLPSLALRKP